MDGFNERDERIVNLEKRVDELEEIVGFLQEEVAGIKSAKAPKKRRQRSAEELERERQKERVRKATTDYAEHEKGIRGGYDYFVGKPTSEVIGAVLSYASMNGIELVGSRGDKDIITRTMQKHCGLVKDGDKYAMKKVEEPGDE